MKRNTLALALAFGSAFTLAAAAQESTTTTKTTTKGEEAKTVMYTGCLQSGTEAKSYILAKIAPVASSTKVEPTGTSGVVATTTTTYALVPSEQVQFQEFVGHKVEVTGMMIPAGESKTETKTKTEVEHGPDITTKEQTKTDSSMPQFRVTSIKHLAESCN